MKKNCKFFIGYLYNGIKVKPLMLPKTSTYFFIEDNDLFKKYNTIWNKVSTDIEKEFDSEPVYNKEFLKTKIKPHADEVTDF